MACDCITLRFGFYILESNNYREGSIVLTSTNNYGNFVNGQPYWQFTESQVFGNVPDGFNIEISQVHGVGAWRIYIIDNVGVPPNSGTEVLRENILLQPPQDCPDFIKYYGKGIETPISSFGGFDDVYVAPGPIAPYRFFARTECCADTNGSFYFHWFKDPTLISNTTYYYALFGIPNGDYNGYPYWQVELLNDDSLGTGLFVQLSRSSDDRWVFYWINSLGQDPSIAGVNDDFYEYFGDPFGVYPDYPADLIGYTGWWRISTVIGYPTVAFGNTWSICETPTPTCVNHEDRHEQEFKSIKLPKPFTEQNRGWKQDCCVCSPMLTLASLTDSESWKNDVTSAWIKLSDPTDVVSFELYKNNVLTTYTPTLVAFPNESDAYYTTIQWSDVLASDGIGCYELRVSYDISGVIGNYVWGSYNLREYSIQNALKTARIRVKFNLQQEIEGINFTNANVEDCIRFNGFIGERQPNTEIDNLIYQNREVKTVVRENLNKYTITTDPSEECLITKLTDLYLLSENEMFISDYNAHNHSYKYLDLPVIVEESPEIDYYNEKQN
jgi:hypothetical protein